MLPMGVETMYRLPEPTFPPDVNTMWKTPPDKDKTEYGKRYGAQRENQCGKLVNKCEKNISTTRNIKHGSKLQC
jgi:hypothetical protein